MKCHAEKVVGGGKKSKRKGHHGVKWHCFSCGLILWTNPDIDLKDQCLKFKKERENEPD